MSLKEETRAHTVSRQQKENEVLLAQEGMQLGTEAKEGKGGPGTHT